MTNLESKQEVIRNVYGKYFIHADSNGWIKYGMYSPSDLDIEDYDEIDSDGMWRCKSLQGIENNNGWIKIESDDDIPKNDMYVHIVFNKKMNIAFLCDGEFFAPNKEKYYKKGVTHYQPIETKKQPIW